MPYADGFHVAASVDATRIAQQALLRDAQLQTAATTSVRHDQEKARRLPEAKRSERGRKQEKERRPGQDEPPEDGHGRRLDRLA